MTEDTYKKAFWFLVIIVALLFISGTCTVYSMLEKSPVDYNYLVVSAVKDRLPETNLLQTAVKLENLESIPGVFVVEQRINTKSQGWVTKTTILSLVAGQPKSFYITWDLAESDILEMKYTITPPKKDVLLSSYKMIGCGFVPRHYEESPYYSQLR